VDGDLSGDEDGEQLAPGPTPMLPCTACTALRDENVRLRLALNASKIVDADAEGDAIMLRLFQIKVVFISTAVQQERARRLRDRVNLRYGV
jgi:hypothetical protein